MKKCLILIGLLLAFTTTAIAVETQFAGIGVQLIKDRNKIFALRLIPNAPAAKVYLPLGCEILQVDDTKITNKTTINDITNLIRGQKGTKVNLLVKNNGKKETYTIERDTINISQKTDQTFDMHWKQVAPEEFVDAIPTVAFPQYSTQLKNDISVINYWASRKENFKNGYDVCNTYPTADRSNCYMNLVNREVNKTIADQQLEAQQQFARQQAIQNFTNSMNQINTNTNLQNINNSLQQQNFQLQNTNMQLFNINNSLRGW